MMTEPGYSNFGCTGSALDFYTAQSRGIYTPKFDVYGPVQLSQNMAYYGGNVNGSDARVPELVKEACELLDGQVDFSQYDTNGDGYVDNVYVFYAGYGENDGGGASCIWPHSWSLHYTMTCPELDGVKIDRYACSNELRFTYDGSLDPTTIGTFCHEFGHVLGQPDVYATDYSDSFTPGSFDCMDHGSYNNDSRTPPNFSAYERYALEWLEPIEIKSATTINMLPLGDGGNVYKFTLDPDTPTDYFLFENRQQTGWDTYIPGHGMLVWHIDFNKSIWDANKPNNTPSHQRIDLIEADGVLSDGSQSADPFPGTKNIGEFTASTTPAFRSWTKFDSKLPITEIQESPAGVISFNVAGGSNTDELVMYAPHPVRHRPQPTLSP